MYEGSLSKAFLKARRGSEGCRVCDQFVHNFLVDVEVTGWYHRVSHYQSLGASRSGLHAHDHQVVNFFHLVVILASEKPRKYACDTIIWVLQREATAEDIGEGDTPRRGGEEKGVKIMKYLTKKQI